MGKTVIFEAMTTPDLRNDRRAAAPAGVDASTLQAWLWWWNEPADAARPERW